MYRMINSIYEKQIKYFTIVIKQRKIEKEKV